VGEARPDSPYGQAVLVTHPDFNLCPPAWVSKTLDTITESQNVRGWKGALWVT